MRLSTVTCFCKKLYLTFAARFSIRLWKVFQVFLLVVEQQWTSGGFVRNGEQILVKTPLKHTWGEQYSLHYFTFFFLVCLLTFSFCPHLQQMNLGNTNYIFSFPFDFRHFWHTSTLFTDHFHRVIIVWSYYCVKWNHFHSGVFIINFEHISQLVLLLLLLILDR